MDIEARLRKLESRYRAALSAAVAAKAHYSTHGGAAPRSRQNIRGKAGMTRRAAD
jgi:hypothetical protein